MLIIPEIILREFPLLTPEYVEIHNYLASRGITQEAYKYFGIRVNPAENELAFCYSNILGNTLGIVFRKITEKKIIGLSVEGVELPKRAKLGAWFGTHLVNVTAPLLIVESELDCLRCYEFGFKNVVSPGGAQVTKQQVKALYNQEVLLGFDSDAAGKHGNNKLKNMLKRGRIINWAPYKDPGEINTREEFWSKINA